MLMPILFLAAAIIPSFLFKLALNQIDIIILGTHALVINISRHSLMEHELSTLELTT